MSDDPYDLSIDDIVDGLLTNGRLAKGFLNPIVYDDQEFTGEFEIESVTEPFYPEEENPEEVIMFCYS